MTPTVGRIVHYFPGNDTAGHSNGCKADDPVAAVITRVWSDTCVNLTVLLDNQPPVVRSSVQHASAVGKPVVEGATVTHWDWPARV